MDDRKNQDLMKALYVNFFLTDAIEILDLALVFPHKIGNNSHDLDLCVVTLFFVVCHV